MMRPRFLFALATGALLWAGAPALAQTPLPLAQAIDDAIAQNPSLSAARAASRQAGAAPTIARAEWLPRIDFTEGWQRSTQPVSGFGTLLNARRFTAADFAVDRLNRPGAVNGFSSRLGISQVIFDAGHTRAAVTMASRKADMAEAKVATAIADLAWQVTRAYGRVAAAEAGIEAAAAALAWAKEDLARAESRRNAGTATDADVLALSVHSADMQQRQLQAQSDAAVARAALNQLMGTPLDRVFTVVLPPATGPAPALSGLIAEAHAARPELREADLGVAIAEAAVRDARGQWLPTIAAGAGYEWDGLTFTERESAWTVSAGLRWSVSLGGAEAGRVRAARAGVDAARAAREAARAAVALEVITAREQWLVADARINVARLSVENARESHRITRQRYAAGLANVRDVLAAAAAELAAEAQRTTNEVDAVTAWAALQRALGRASFTR